MIFNRLSCLILICSILLSSSQSTWAVRTGKNGDTSGSGNSVSHQQSDITVTVAKRKSPSPEPSEAPSLLSSSLPIPAIIPAFIVPPLSFSPAPPPAYLASAIRAFVVPPFSFTAQPTPVSFSSQQAPVSGSSQSAPQFKKTKLRSAVLSSSSSFEEETKERVLRKRRNPTTEAATTETSSSSAQTGLFPPFPLDTLTHEEFALPLDILQPQRSKKKEPGQFKRQKKVLTQSVQQYSDITVKDYDYNELLNFLNVENEKNIKDYKDRFAAFVKLLTWDDQPNNFTNGYWRAWIKLPTFDSDGNSHYLHLRVVRTPFISEISTEAELQRVLGSRPDRQGSYYSIYIDEYTVGKHVPNLAHIRIEENGRAGELITIKKGSYISGSEILKLSLKISDLLKPAAFFLFDEAKIYVDISTPEQKQKPLTLLTRNFYPLVSQHGGAWYEEMGGFVPLNFMRIDGLVVNHKQNLFKYSNRLVYFAAIKKLRALPLAVLYQALSENPDFRDRTQALEYLINSYFSLELNFGNANLSLMQRLEQSALTLSDLVKRVYNQQRGKEASLKNPLELRKDFSLLYNSILTFPAKDVKGNISPSLRSYIMAVRIMEWHCIWVKFDPEAKLPWREDSALKNEPLNLLRKADMTAQTFDVIMDGLDPTINNWDVAAPQILVGPNAADDGVSNPFIKY